MEKPKLRSLMSPDVVVEDFQAPVVEPESDGGEDPVAVAADGAGESYEELHARPGCPGQPGVEIVARERGVLELVAQPKPPLSRKAR